MDKNNEILLYTTVDGKQKLEVNLQDDTVWLSLDQIADLFQRNKSTISRHIKNIFEEGELVQDSVVAKFATTAADGKTYKVDYYNLDAIISVGYRVNSIRGTHFRMWASGVLKEFMIKGFAMDDERLKRGGGGICVISGFHSPLEKDVLHFLLKGKQPVIMVLGRSLYKQIPEEFHKSLEEDRLLIVSSVAQSIHRHSAENSLLRNKYIVDTADEIVFGSLDKNGSLYPLYQRAQLKGKKISIINQKLAEQANLE